MWCCYWSHWRFIYLSLLSRVMSSVICYCLISVFFYWWTRLTTAVMKCIIFTSLSSSSCDKICLVTTRETACVFGGVSLSVCNTITCESLTSSVRVWSVGTSSRDTCQVRIWRSPGQGHQRKSAKTENSLFLQCETLIASVCMQHRFLSYGGSNGMTGNTCIRG